jgi:hypothetical protein
MCVCVCVCSLQAPSSVAGVDKKQLIADVRAALYCSKVCSYAQGMNIIKKKSDEKGWGVDLGGLARIWKVRNTTAALSLPTASRQSCQRHICHPHGFKHRAPRSRNCAPGMVASLLGTTACVIIL